ncbi:GDSL-type esterase/lipase family protein [Roseicitreum antarcticum]|uniref:Lysophospholipase L1 n=1 Tax=Roseicitreum antarcticum TaxID=564137 RepID=A0A1H2Z9M9_9RHOB|nr:GDSL-type esterase/lipase family protein [Roseicitreum antarcticum]SDX14061.1 Lysophospholipase L1 [Roseicitreum antarcticum]
MPVVLCFGDSNTYGSVPLGDAGRWTRYDTQTRWPRRMAGLLGPDWDVVEEGLPGRTTCHDNPFDGPHKNGLRLLPAILESHAPVDIVVMMLGTNDLKAHLGLTAFDIAKGVFTLGRRILLSDAGPDGAPPRLLIVSPVPVVELGARSESLRGGAEKSRRLGPMLAAHAHELGAAFLDAGTVAMASPIDGVHLPPEAHAALAVAVAEAVTGMQTG